MNNLIEQLKDHQLELVQSGTVTAYYLKQPGTRMMSTLILFSPEGIAMIGDLTPERNGSVSALGYGIRWFAGELGESYLCSKFLEKKWDAHAAILELKSGEWFKQRRDEPLTEEQQERADYIIANIEDSGPRWLHDELRELGFDADGDMPGWGYLERESGWLCAIQQKFAELYRKQNVENAK